MNIEEKVVKKLNEKNMLLTTAESCTAGMIASAIVNVSGASNVFHQGYITYCDEAKNSMLNVKKETLNKIEEDFNLDKLKIIDKKVGKDVTKYLFELND